jgi:hypothetical protein
VTTKRLLARFVSVAALVDLGMFCASFVFFGGAHGPQGPFFVLDVLNAPVAAIVLPLFPLETSTTIGVLAAFGIVAVNGALYGLLLGGVFAFWRAGLRERGRR